MQVGVNKVSMLSLLVLAIAIDATVECAKKLDTVDRILYADDLILKVKVSRPLEINFGNNKRHL